MDKEPARIPIKTDAGDPAACGPGCSCGKSPLGTKEKTAVSLIILLVVLGILFYKATNAKQNTSADPSSKGALAFIPPTGTNTIPAAVAKSFKPGQKIWEDLESLGNLNEVAVDQDAVFIYIPAKNNEPADNKTNEAVFASLQALKAKDIKLGLYALKSGSPDYSTLSGQFQLPAILVASKGKGMTTVSGEVTETKLLQAYITSSRAGGCGCGSGTGKAPAGRKCPVKS